VTVADPEPVARLLERLVELGIDYCRYDHEAVFTCEEAERAVPDRDPSVAHTKNLFLRDQKGRRHWLLVTSCAKSVDLKALAATIGSDKLGLASPERLARYLGVTPGSVTLFGLVHDVERAVALLVDREVWDAPAWRCHPLVNTATLVVPKAGVEAFLAATGHRPGIIDVIGRS
jgi:Ala-tRNA(Pro) deacylase